MYTELIKKWELDYIEFMGIESLPSYNLTTKKVSQTLADEKGFESVALVNYNPNSKTHSLCVSSNLPLSKYLIFHEFTHMLDTEVYANGDKHKYAYLSGFTEYHASQIELLQLLGAKKHDEAISFSINDPINTFSKKTSVYDYMTTKRDLSIELFERDEFKTDIVTFKTAIGILYNYWGLRSICEMYAIDYKEEKNKNNAFLNVMSSLEFITLNNLMHGWIGKEKIELCMILYFNIVNKLIRDFGLI